MKFTEKDIDNCKKIFKLLSIKKIDKLIEKQDEMTISTVLRSTLQKIRSKDGNHNLVKKIANNEINLKGGAMQQYPYELQMNPAYLQQYQEMPPDMGYPQEQYQEMPPEMGYPQEQYQEMPPEMGYPEQYQEMPQEMGPPQEQYDLQYYG